MSPEFVDRVLKVGQTATMKSLLFPEFVAQERDEVRVGIVIERRLRCGARDAPPLRGGGLRRFWFGAGLLLGGNGLHGTP